jgi:hypothetical protein
MYRTVVTICTAQWSLYVPYSGHYMYRTAVTICSVQWSLYVLHSGHYMHRTAVTICTVQRSLYIPHSGHYMYRTVVTICTSSLTFNNPTFCPHNVFMCFVWISEQTNNHYTSRQFFFSLPVKIPGNYYGFDISDSQYDNQIAVTHQS